MMTNNTHSNLLRVALLIGLAYRRSWAIRLAGSIDRGQGAGGIARNRGGLVTLSGYKVADFITKGPVIGGVR